MSASTSNWPQKVFVRFNQATSGDTIRLNSTTLYPTDGNTWMHVAATYDGATIRLYVNGVEEANMASSTPIGTNALNLGIGAQPDGLTSLRGTLDDVLLYNSALSAPEIAALAAAAPPSEPPTFTNIPVTDTTGEKPQSKLWQYDGTWWAVLPTRAVSPAGTWIWRLNNDDTWSNVHRVSGNTNVQADAKSVGDVTHILLHGPSPELVSVQYDAGGRHVSNRGRAGRLRRRSRCRTARSRRSTSIQRGGCGSRPRTVRISTSTTAIRPIPLFTGPITFANNINDDDIGVVTALPNDTVGVLWSNQTTRRFGFKVHVDGQLPDLVG